MTSMTDSIYRASYGTCAEKAALRHNPDPIVRARVARHGSDDDRAAMHDDPYWIVRRFSVTPRDGVA